jgi:hypothetical protein
MDYKQVLLMEKKKWNMQIFRCWFAEITEFFVLLEMSKLQERMYVLQEHMILAVIVMLNIYQADAGKLSIK